MVAAKSIGLVAGWWCMFRGRVGDDEDTGVCQGEGVGACVDESG